MARTWSATAAGPCSWICCAGVRGPMICGIDFFGADKVLFASDCPFDKEKGPGYIRSTIAVLESIEMPKETREKISYKNAQKLFGVK